VADSQDVRGLLVLLFLLVLAVPTAAVAQSPDATPTVEADDPGVVDDPSDAAGDEVLEDEIPEYDVPGGDGDYCSGDGDYSYYTYCYPSVPKPVANDDGGGGQKDKDDEDDSDVGPGNAGGGPTPRGSLARTGGEPAVLALLGLALICLGSGGRLITARR
jgi:hypothetical protein